MSPFNKKQKKQKKTWKHAKLHLFWNLQMRQAQL